VPTTTKNPIYRQRVEDELAATLHDRLICERFVPAIRAYVEGKGDKFNRADFHLAEAMAKVSRENRKVGFTVTAPFLAQVTSYAVKTAERFFRKVEGCPLFDLVPGQKSHCRNFRRRATIALSAQAEGELDITKVRREVRKVRSVRNKAYQAVLGRQPKATPRRSTGESLHFARDSRTVPDHQLGSTRSSENHKTIQRPVSHKQFGKQHKASVTALPKVCDAYKPFLSKIAKIIEEIPGKHPLVLGVLITLINTSVLSPTEALEALPEAGREAVLKGKNDPRAWALNCLKNRDQAARFLVSKPMEAQVESIPERVPPSQALNPIESQAPLEAEITKCLMSRYPAMRAAGARLAAESLVRYLPGVPGIGFLPHLITEVEKIYKKKSDWGQIRESEIGYLIGVFREPNEGIFRRAFTSYKRDPNAYANFWEPPTPEVVADPRWDNVLEPLRSDPKARQAFNNWKHCESEAPGSDAPGFLDHYDQERRLLQELLVIAERILGGQAKTLHESLRSRMVERNLPEGGLVWKRTWSYHWSRVICDYFRIPAYGTCQRL